MKAGEIKPWEIHWYECPADAADVKYAKNEGREIKVGDALWRVPIAVDVISPEHDHWAGWHLGHGEEVAKAVTMAAASPVMLHVLKSVLEYENISLITKTEIEFVIKLAEEGE